MLECPVGLYLVYGPLNENADRSNPPGLRHIFFCELFLSCKINMQTFLTTMLCNLGSHTFREGWGIQFDSLHLRVIVQNEASVCHDFIPRDKVVAYAAVPGDEFM